jgi:cytosine/adenosine deaminase-related metal-dependent hydrolase
MTKLYSARWVLPITSERVEGGAVAVEGRRIAAVGTRDELTARYPDAEVEEFGEAAILPGLVNCHTHLELTALRGFLEPEEGDFLAWLRKVTRSRNERMTEEDLYASAAWGAVEALRAGVTTVGDAGDSGRTTMPAMADAGLRGVVFQEAFGVDEREAAGQFGKARAKIAALRPLETPLVRLGLSPHSPYTVSRPLVELLTHFALAEALPVMMHAAESRAEELFLRDAAGPFADNYRARGFAWSAPGLSTVQYLASIGFLRTRPLLAHCVRLDARDVETLNEHGAAVAHCPKSNAKLGHGRAPLASFLNAGLTVGLGSDSVASNNTNDLLEEARFALLASRAAGDTLADGRMLAAPDLLRAATCGGARALGLGNSVGSLEAGREADLAVFRLDGPHQTPAYDPTTALVFSTSGRDALLTVVAGREVYRGGRVLTVDEESIRGRLADVARRLGAEAS